MSTNPNAIEPCQTDFIFSFNKIYKLFELLKFMNRGDKVYKLANKIAKELKPFCKRIEIAVRVRRKKPNPGDIDIVLVAKNEGNKQKIKDRLSKDGKFLQGGNKEMFFKIEGIDLQLFFSIPEEWGATLLAYSGEKGSNIGLRIFSTKNKASN